MTQRQILSKKNLENGKLEKKQLKKKNFWIRLLRLFLAGWK